jgi:hypothetical protein
LRSASSSHGSRAISAQRAASASMSLCPSFTAS